MKTNTDLKWRDIFLICFLVCIAGVFTIVAITFQAVIIVVCFVSVLVSVIVYGAYKAARWMFKR